MELGRMVLIDRDNLAEKMCKHCKDVQCGYPCGTEKCMLEDVFSAKIVDAEPVVRCKDCVNATEKIGTDDLMCTAYFCTVMPNGFCEKGSVDRNIREELLVFSDAIYRKIGE